MVIESFSLNFNHTVPDIVIDFGIQLCKYDSSVLYSSCEIILKILTKGIYKVYCLDGICIEDDFKILSLIDDMLYKNTILIQLYAN